MKGGPPTATETARQGADGRLTRFQGFVVNVLHDILRAPGVDTDARIEDALGQIGLFLGCDRTYVFRVRDKALLDNTHEWAAPDIEPMRDHLQGLPLDMIDPWMPEFLQRRAVRIDSVADLDDSRPEKETLVMQEIQSLLVVPMMHDGALVGFVGFDRVRRQKKFLQGEVYLLQSAADVIMFVLLRRDTEAQARASDQALRGERVFLRSILETAGSAIIAFDEGQDIVFSNQQARKILAQLHRPGEGERGEQPGDRPGSAAQDYLGLIAQQVQESGRAIRDVQHVVHYADGSRHILSVNAAPVPAGDPSNPARIVCSITDLTREVAIQNALQSALSDAHQLAFFDTLTGLPNRRLVIEHLRRLAEEHGLAGGHAALLTIDIDRMRGINELHGVQQGDRVLIEIARRLGEIAANANQLGRIAGSEFTFLLPGPFENAAQATAVADHFAEEILEAVRTPIDSCDTTVSATASIGIVVFPAAEGTESVLDHAGAAARTAKLEGGDGIAWFHAELHHRVVAQAQLDADLPGALARDEFLLFYEPQIRWLGGTRRIIGYEALIRWMHPQRGLLSPIEFIGHAEQTGMISEIDDWVLRETLRQAKIWNDLRSSADFVLSINVSPRRFAEEGFAEHVERTVRQSGVNPHQLRFELTERSLIKDAEQAREVMQRLSSMGIGLALDDFGTGFSSLRYLHDLPVTMLKIDRSFVRNLWESERNGTIINSILSLGRDLRLDVMAEGVETRAQLDWLAAQGCSLFQGYYFARPRAAAEIAIDFATHMQEIGGDGPDEPRRG
ncbi:putative bifunctional diguanylate cyclase/phosphodiesterase [Halodurantibacterium flavum]|uniref:Bifunctional diguanylate cyclase/phosphodiesterase n=1 Tax=Halodurantibacterium flavum TaxID=1382802 RepID=A0ABW4S653_9RHOB